MAPHTGLAGSGTPRGHIGVGVSVSEPRAQQERLGLCAAGRGADTQPLLPPCHHLCAQGSRCPSLCHVTLSPVPIPAPQSALAPDRAQQERGRAGPSPGAVPAPLPATARLRGPSPLRALLQAGLAFRWKEGCSGETNPCSGKHIKGVTLYRGEEGAGRELYLVPSSGLPSPSVFPSSSVFWSSVFSLCCFFRRTHFTTISTRMTTARKPPTEAPTMTATVESRFGGSGETEQGQATQPQTPEATKRQGQGWRQGQEPAQHPWVPARRGDHSPPTFGEHLEADAGVAPLPVGGVEDVAVVGALVLQLHVVEGEGHVVLGGVPGELHAVPEAVQLLVHDLRPELQELGSGHGEGLGHCSAP